MKLAARRFKTRARALVAELVLPRSLRSVRPWSLRNWPVHDSSSPPEMELRDYLEYPEMQKLLKQTMVSNLGDMHTREIDMSNASDVAAELQDAEPLLRRYEVELVKERSSWRFRAQNSALFDRVVDDVLKTLSLRRQSVTYDMVAVALVRGLREVEKVRRADEEKGYTFYRRQKVRRSIDAESSKTGGGGGGIMRKVALGRRMHGVVGTGELENYRLPADLSRWLNTRGITYRPEFNPRLRRKKQYCIPVVETANAKAKGKGKTKGKGKAKRTPRCISLPRARFVWGFNFGLDTKAAGEMLKWLTDKAHISMVDGRRNWHSIWPEVFEFKVSPRTEARDQKLRDAHRMLVNMMRKSLYYKRGYAVYCAFQTSSGGGHANIMAIQAFSEPSFRVVARILDPHASSPPSRFTESTRAELTSVLWSALREVSKGAPTGGVDMATCGFQNRWMAKALRVQYGLEGVCGPSSMALLLSAVREMSGRRKRLDHSMFCSRVYSHVRIQDAVLVMQLVYRL